MRLLNVRATLLLGICLTSQLASASLSIVLGWDPSPDTEIAGYRLHIGNQLGVYTRTIDVGPATQAVASELEWDTLYYFAVSAYDASSLESDLSDPIAYRTPQAPIVTIDPPIIHEQPIDQLVAKGSNTTLVAKWTGSSPLICQWYRAELPLSDGEQYQGVNSESLTILHADGGSEGLYYLVLSNPAGAVKSTQVYVHVLTQPRIESVVALGNGASRITIVNQDGSPLAPEQVFRVTVRHLNPTGFR